MAEKREPLPSERLLAHLKTTDTRWFRVSLALMSYGRRGVPAMQAHSWNPTKWLASELGLWMDIRQTEKTNRRLNR